MSYCLMAHYLPYLSKPLKMIILHFTKFYPGKILLILLPKMSPPIMTNYCQQDQVDPTSNISTVISKNNHRARKKPRDGVKLTSN